MAMPAPVDHVRALGVVDVAEGGVAVVGRPAVHGVGAIDLAWEQHTVAVEGQERVLELGELAEVLRPADTDGRTVAGPEEVPAWEEAGLEEEADPALIWRDMRTIQYTLWNYVGLARSTGRLARAMRDLNHLKEAVDDFYRTTRLNDGLIGLRHSVQAALIVAEAAQRNRVSRGCHFRDDRRGAGPV